MKKMVMALVMSAVVALSAGMMVGCGSDDAQVIEDALIQELDSIKNQDPEFVSEMAASVSTSGIEQLGVDANEFVTSYLTGFDYTIGEVTVDGETATVPVTLTCKSYTALMADVNNLQNDSEVISAISAMTSQDEAYKYLGGKVMELLDAVAVAECAPITVEYNLIDGEWTPTAASEQAITNAMLSN